MPSVKLIARRAKCIQTAKVQRCSADIYCNRQCLKQGVVPKYAQIKIPYTSAASEITLKKTQISRLKEEIKFLCKPVF